MLDVEGEASKVGRASLTKWCLAWLQEVQRLTGHSVMIYTGASLAGTYLGKELADHLLWVAHYGVLQPMNNGTWTSWSAFQYTSTGSVTGIVGNVDMNVMEREFYERFVPPAIKPPPMNEKPSAKVIPKVVKDGKPIVVGNLVDGRLVAPVSDVLDAAGVQYHWDNNTKKLYLL